MDLSNIEELLIEFMKIESATGNEGKFARYVESVLISNGWYVLIQPLNSTSDRLNILATRKPLSETFSPRLILNTHLDTVPPYIPPTQDDNNIYGRGSNDAKGQIACQISVADHFVRVNPSFADQIGLLFVVGEEVDHVGMIKANELNINPEYLIVGEPTELKLATIQKGALKVLLSAAGIAGHSGYPSVGESAIHKLIPVLNDILQNKWPSDSKFGDTTLNIGLIEGGQAQNAWAAKAEARIFFRITTSVDDISKQLESIVKGRVSVEVLSYNEPVLLSESPLPLPVDQVAFNTDLPYYNKLDSLKGRYLFGAGSIKNAHSADEFMPKKELHQCKQTLIQIITKLLSQ